MASRLLTGGVALIGMLNVGAPPLRGCAPYCQPVDAGEVALSEAPMVPLPSRASADSQHRAARHFALLVGIGDYVNFTFEGEPGETDLQGPPNDVERVRTSLRRWGFDGENVRVLTDGEATRQGILDGFRWLAGQATQPEDVVVIYYSGHGTYTADSDGDERLVSSGDNYDEALVPADARDIQAAGQLILDDDIREALERLGTTNVTIIIDACYSGTMTRGQGEVPLRRARGPVAPGGGQSGAIEALDHPEHTLITAASALQVAEELPFGSENTVFGVLTYHLTRALDGADPDARYDDLMREIRAGVSGSLVPQTPQLEGDRGARLFRVTAGVARRPFAVVSEASPQQVTLDVGALHGVRLGARYDVFGSDELQFLGQPPAQVVIEEIGETTSIARVAEGGGVRVGSRAVLARIPPGAATLTELPVYVHPNARGLSGLATALGSLAWIKVTEDSTAAATHLAASAGGPQIRVNGLVIPQLEAATNLAGQICEPLRRAFAIRSYELISNPHPPTELDVRIRLVPTGTQPGNEQITVDTAYIGQHYDIFARVDAPANSTFYFSAAAVGYTSEPAVLFPAGDVLNQPFPLNTWVRIVPRVQMVEPAGLEVIKAVANSEQFDFHSLQATLPGCAASRGGSRWDPDPSPVTGWATLDHRVVILPAAARR